MLTHLRVKTQPLSRPQSAVLPQRQFGNFPTHTNKLSTQFGLVSYDKIILPVKEYSNKFLRENKDKDQLICNHNIFKPKKSVVFNRKQLKNRRNKQIKLLQNKQNQTHSIKTQTSCLYTQTQQQQRQRKNSWTKYQQNPIARCLSTPNSRDRISTSRALQLFSRVFKNQNVQRLRIRRQIMTKKLDVQIKQVKLQDKGQKKMKKLYTMTAIPKRFNIHSQFVTRQSKNKDKLMFNDDQNFQLAGW